MKSIKSNQNNDSQASKIETQIRKYLVTNAEGISEGIKNFIDQIISQLEQRNQELEQRNQELEQRNQILQKDNWGIKVQRDDINGRFDKLENAYRKQKLAGKDDITFANVDFRDQFANFKTQRLNDFIAQIQNKGSLAPNQEKTFIRKHDLKEILSRNIFLNMNSNPLDIMDDIYKELAWNKRETWEELKPEVQKFISECHELVRKAWCMIPQGSILMCRTGTPFNPDTHEVAPGYKEAGMITATLFPAYLIKSKVLVKALVLTEPESFFTEEAAEKSMADMVYLTPSPATSTTQAQPEEVCQQALPEKKNREDSVPQSEISREILHQNQKYLQEILH